jgi:murein DD-endopeptidase MepM/ murein hydrolase activator NlpD
MIPLLIASFYLGGAVGWWLHASLATPIPSISRSAEARIEPTNGRAGDSARRETSDHESSSPVATPPVSDEHDAVWRANPIDDLRERRLRLPIDDASTARMKGGFAERRDGTRAHEAVDILAPRNTPIHAVEDGTIAKLFQSKAGGTTVYQFDPSRHFCYYYAHLQQYAAGLHEGQTVSRGDVLGYVGTSGNAPPGTPHLHFAIFALTPEQRWWEGRAIDPYLIFSKAESGDGP